MRVRGMSGQPGGSIGTVRQNDLTAPIGEPPLRFYRSTFYLDLTTGDAAEAIRIDHEEGETRLVGRFEQLDYDALEVEGAIVTRKGSGLVVDLRAIRRITRLGFNPGRVPAAGYELRLYRTDGAEPVGDPFHTVINGTVYTTRYDGPTPVTRLIEGGGDGPIGSDFNRLPPHHDDRFVVQVNPSFAIERREQRFYLQLVRPDGGIQALNPADLHEIRVRSAPTNPRVGLALPDPAGAGDPTPGAAVFFWRGHGEPGESASLEEAALPPGSAFGAELQRLLDRYASQRGETRQPPAALPSTLTAALVFESDAPCRVKIDDFEIAYALQRRALPDGEQKKVLRFVAGRRETEDVRFALPAGSRIEAGALRVEPAFSADRDAGGAAGSTPLPRRGGHVAGDQVMAQPLTLSDASRISGVSLALLPTSQTTELVLELREDRDGAPGRVIRDAALRTSATAPRWYDVRFPEPALLSTAPHWLHLRALSGSAIWIVATPGDESMGAPHILRPGSLPGSWQTATQLTGSHALHRLRTRSGPGAGTPPVEVRLGEEALELTPLEGGPTLGADLGNAFETLSAGRAGDRITDLTISFSATGPGRLTLYPIDLVYHLE